MLTEEYLSSMEEHLCKNKDCLSKCRDVEILIAEVRRLKKLSASEDDKWLEGAIKQCIAAQERFK